MRKPMPITPFTALIEDFLSDLGSANTRRAYRSDLTQFAQWRIVGSEQISNPIDHLKKIEYKNIESYLENLRNLGREFSTMARALSAISEWFRYLGLHGYVELNPCSGLVGPKVPKRLPKVPSAAKMKAICDLIDPDHASWPSRDQAIFELLYGTGIQVFELCALDLDNIDWATKSIFVRNQYGKVRQLPLADLALKSLLIYLDERVARLAARGATDNATPVFLNAKLSGLGNPKRLARLTTRSVLRITKGRGSDLNPRSIRWACGLHLANNGAGVRILGAQLGIGIASANKIKEMSTPSLQRRLRTYP